MVALPYLSGPAALDAEIGRGCGPRREGTSIDEMQRCG
jgi:hypothetical protein